MFLNVIMNFRFFYPYFKIYHPMGLRSSRKEHRTVKGTDIYFFIFFVKSDKNRNGFILSFPRYCGGKKSVSSNCLNEFSF